MPYVNAGRFAEAIPMVDNLLRATPDMANAYGVRALCDLAVNHGFEAFADASHYLELKQPDNGFGQVILTFGYLGLRMAGRDDEARTFLENKLTACKQETAVYPILQYLLGKSSAEDTLHRMAKPKEIGTAKVIMGYNLILSGNRAQGREYLLWVTQNIPNTENTYHLAVAGLQQYNISQPSPASEVKTPARQEKSAGDDSMPGKILESEAVAIGSKGGTIELANGARLSLPSGVLQGATEIRLFRSPFPEQATNQCLLSDVYYLTASNWVDIKGDYCLLIPCDSKRLAAIGPTNELQVYAMCNNRLLYPVPCRIDAARGVVEVNNPLVVLREIPPELVFSQGEMRAALFPPKIGHIVVSRYLGPYSFLALAGPRPALEVPQHAFRIIWYNTSTPVNFGISVSSALQDAYNLYGRLYNRGQPFFNLGPDNRMNIFLHETLPVIASYSALGLGGSRFIRVDATEGNNNPLHLRDTLYHEFFHALEDSIVSLPAAYWMSALWWMEASASWAGYHHGLNMSLEDQTRERLRIYDSCFSYPMYESSKVDSAEGHYGYALLIDYVMRQNPQYVEQTLWKGLRADLYLDMVAAGNLEKTYPDFVRILAANTIPYGVEPWNIGRVIIREDTPASGTARAAYRYLARTSEAESNVARRPRAQYQKNVFNLTVQPLTVVFIYVEGGNPSAARTTYRPFQTPRNVKVKMTSLWDIPSDNAWLITEQFFPSVNERRPAPPRAQAAATPRRLSEKGTMVRGIGGAEINKLWIAVFNPDAKLACGYKLAIMEPSAVFTGLVQNAVSRKPVEGAEVALAELSLKGTTGKDGGFAIELPQTGEFKYKAQADDYEAQEGTVRIEEEGRPVTIDLIPLEAEIRIRVEDSTSENPIAGALVGLTGETATYKGMTDGTGEARVKVRTGKLTVTASADGYEKGTAACEAVAEESRLATIRLTKILVRPHIHYTIDKVTGTSYAGTPRDYAQESTGELAAVQGSIPISYSETWDKGHANMNGRVEISPAAPGPQARPGETWVTIRVNASWDNQGLGLERPTGIFITTGVDKGAKDDKGWFENGSTSASATWTGPIDQGVKIEVIGKANRIVHLSLSKEVK